MKAGMANDFPDSNRILEDLQMITTIVGIIITALAIEADKITRYRHNGFPLVALAGVVTVVISLVV